MAVQGDRYRVESPLLTSDPNSVANIGDVRVKHYHFDIATDFSTQTISGSVSLTFHVVNPLGAQQMRLDVRDVAVHAVDFQGASLPFQVLPAPLGQALAIAFPAALTPSQGDLSLSVRFATSPAASGLQWLPPQQTSDKLHPYLFSQFQAIHARSFAPCQDTPAVKSSYSAAVEVPCGLTALMSAISDGDEPAASGEGRRRFLFSQKVPIPSYLIALVVGHLDSREIGPRSRVWAEPSVIAAAAAEFTDTEDYLRVAEELLTPYEWGRYDLLVLPGSFPYGGMENPCLTFVTPTLLAGDRSLTFVVAHEIAHSWMGNLVTNQSWEHFWMNEGFTVFIERKILGRLHGEPIRHFNGIEGWNHLKDSVDVFGADSPFTALLLRLQDVDPDDSFSSVPYERGFAFLFFLETLVGVAPFEAFLVQWVQQNAFGTVTTQQFRAFFESHFAAAKSAWEGKIDWDAWLSAPGMPPVDVRTLMDHSLVHVCEQLATQWTTAPESATSAADFEKFSTGQKSLFLDMLLENLTKLSLDTLAKIDAQYALTQSSNSEIRFRWYRLAIRAGYSAVNERLVQFLTIQGRMKFVRPLYRDLFHHGGEAGKKLAFETFKANQTSYNNIASKMIAKDLELSP